MPSDADGPKGAPGRAAAAQRDAWRTLRLTAGFLAAAVVVALAGGGGRTWMVLHLVLLGGALTAISAATQLFAVTWSAAPAPDPRVVAAQRRLLAAGAVLVIAAREADWPLAAGAIGGALVVASLVLLAGILLEIRRRAVTPRFAPAIDAYLGAIGLGVGGSLLGIALATGGAATVEARHAHIALNVFGMVGLVVAATLPTFVATQVRAKVSPRATAGRQRAIVASLGAAVLVAVGGVVTGVQVIAAVGFGAYAVSAATTVILLPRLGAKQRRWAGPRLYQLLAGVAWWVVGAAWAGAWSLGIAEVDRLWLVVGVGGYAQLVVASLAYLGPIIRGRDGISQPRAFRITRSWIALVAGNVLAVALLLGAGPVAAIAAAVWGLDVVARATLLVALVRPSPVASTRARALRR